jgi:DNA polymerase I-like protein with 3'-5' exonuclease and polymerase domains
MTESPLANVQLHFVESIDDVLAMREWASEQRETPIGCDTESEGLNPVSDRLRLIQLGDKRHGWAVPIEWAGAVIELLRDLFRRHERVVFHHSCFDVRVIQHSLGYQVPWSYVDDTLILAALADPTRPKGLKPLSSRIIDRNATAGQRLLDEGMKVNGWTWATVPASFPPYWAYAALDPVLTCHIYDLLAPGVLKTAPEAYDLERSVTPLLASMMDAGLLIDKEYVTAKLNELREYTVSAREWLDAAHGVTSLMSARQLDAALQAQGIIIADRTPTGLPSITKDTLDGIVRSSGDVSQAARDLAATVLKTRHAEKLAGTYLENFLELAAFDGAIHPSINQLPARTSRMCLAAGSMVDAPRDLVRYPLGIPIQDIKPGDDVYSFDNRGTVIVQRVKKVHNNGALPVVRLVYRRSGTHGGELLQLKATPDHRIALRTGEYRELRDLKPGDKLGFMVRTIYTDGNGKFRSMLEWNGGKRFHEPRVISEAFSQHVVHHENGETLDQRIGNLDSLTRSDHIKQHALGLLYAMSREELQQFVDADTNYTRTAMKLGGAMVRKKDVIQRCRELGVQVRSHQESIIKHWEVECPLTPVEFWKRIEELGGTGTGTGGGAKLARELGVSYNLIRKWKRQFSVSNHEVIAVVDDNESVPVYDLEMNGYPNFIANEVWVHNSCSEPNLQNLPTTDTIVRGGIIPRPGYVLISSDFSQIEMRIAASLSKDPGLIAAFAEADAGGRDFYSGIAGDLFGGIIDKSDPRRQAVKSMSYASLYGAGLAKQALTAGVSVAQLRPIREAFDARFPGLSRLPSLINEEAVHLSRSDPEGRPAVRTSTGRYLPGEKRKAYALLNYKIQGEAAEQLKRAIASVAAAGLGGMVRLPVHDELLFEVPAGDIDEVKSAIVEAMTDNNRYAVPITCEAKVMPERWAK